MNFLVFFLLFFIYRVQCADLQGITFKQEGTAGFPKGDAMIQRLTKPYKLTSGLFANDTGLIYCETLDTIFCFWNYNTGTTKCVFLEKIQGQRLSFAIPLKDHPNTFLVGHSQHISLVTVDSDFNLEYMSDPIAMVPTDKHYINYRAHANSKGELYILANTDAVLGAKLYHFKDGDYKLVKTFQRKVYDFAWSKDDNELYVSNRSSIVKFTFNDDSLSNGEIIFKRDQRDDLNIQSIDVDSNDCILFVADSLLGKVSTDGELTEVVQTPSENPTAITIGGYKNRNIYVGTKMGCNHRIHDGAIFGVTGMKVTAVPDYPSNYDPDNSK